MIALDMVDAKTSSTRFLDRGHLLRVCIIIIWWVQFYCAGNYPYRGADETMTMEWISWMLFSFLLLLSFSIAEKVVDQAINIPYYCSTNAVYQEIDMYMSSTVWLEENSQNNTTALLAQSTQVLTPKWEPHPPYIGTTANGGRRHTQESRVGGRSTERAIAKEFGKRTNNEGRIARARCALLGSESGDGARCVPWYGRRVLIQNRTTPRDTSRKMLWESSDSKEWPIYWEWRILSAIYLSLHKWNNELLSDASPRINFWRTLGHTTKLRFLIRELELLHCLKKCRLVHRVSWQI